MLSVRFVERNAPDVIIRRVAANDRLLVGRFLEGRAGVGFFQSEGGASFVSFTGLGESVEYAAFCDGSVVGSWKLVQLGGRFTSRLIAWGYPVIADLPADVEGDVLQALVRFAVQDSRGDVVYVEIRPHDEISPQRKVQFEVLGFRYLPYMNVVIPITGEADVLEGMNRYRARQIRRSFRRGARITRLEGRGEVAAFHWILRELYLDRVRKPVPPLSFFERAVEWSESHTSAALLGVVADDDEVIGGTLLLRTDDTVYPFYSAGVMDAHQELSPSVMANWAAIRYACEEEASRFDFMGAGLRDRPYGVRDFKMQFGGQLIETGRFLLVRRPIIYHLARIALKIYQHLPFRLDRLLEQGFGGERVTLGG